MAVLSSLDRKKMVCKQNKICETFHTYYILLTNTLILTIDSKLTPESWRLSLLYTVLVSILPNILWLLPFCLIICIVKLLLERSLWIKDISSLNRHDSLILKNRYVGGQYVGLYIVLGQLMKFSCDTLLTEQKNHALLISRNLVKIGLEWNFDTFTYILRNRGFFLSMSFRGWEKDLFTRPKWRPPSHCLQLFDQYSKAAAE